MPTKINRMRSHSVAIGVKTSSVTGAKATKTASQAVLKMRRERFSRVGLSNSTVNSKL